ncbi:MAG: hypothetical protein EBZ99_04940, partial [Actinobacteria bacterium]|nr:hypothetical protein [Actinomycetota bacterium]
MAMIKDLIYGIRKSDSRLSLRIAFWVPLITFGPVNLYVYRQGDPSEIRDLGVWIRAAESIINKEDPYVTSDGLFKSGPVSSFLLLGFRVLLFQNEALFFYLTMCLNLIGMMAFTAWFTRYFKISNITLLICNSIIICSSFTREMLVTGQVTGLIFGALALIAHLSNKTILNKTLHAFPLITLLSALVVDLKPNIFLFP